MQSSFFIPTLCLQQEMKIFRFLHVICFSLLATDIVIFMTGHIRHDEAKILFTLKRKHVYVVGSILYLFLNSQSLCLITFLII